MTKKITLLFLILTDFCFAQTTTDLIVTSVVSGLAEILIPKEVHHEFHNGFIVVNSDTIKGPIQFGSTRIYYMSETDRKSIKLKKVTSVRLFAADTLITQKGYMDFVQLGKFLGLMYRRIYSGSFEIFDRNYYTNEVPGYIGDDLIILDEGKIIQDINSSSFPKKYMVKCINKKFNKDLKASDFNRKVDVIRWLKLSDKSYIDK